jgi:plastocyanin
LLSVSRLVLVLCAAAALTIGALAGTAGARGGATVKLGDDFFKPTEKTVSKGTKVKFKWVGTDKHNIVKKSGPGSAIDSGVQQGSGVLYTHKFKKKGTYKLICTIHDGMKMTLKVN